MSGAQACCQPALLPQGHHLIMPMLSSCINHMDETCTIGHVFFTEMLHQTKRLLQGERWERVLSIWCLREGVQLWEGRCPVLLSLPVHTHAWEDAAVWQTTHMFAQYRHRQCVWGKAHAWLVLEAAAGARPPPSVHNHHHAGLMVVGIVVVVWEGCMQSRQGVVMRSPTAPILPAAHQTSPKVLVVCLSHAAAPCAALTHTQRNQQGTKNHPGNSSGTKKNAVAGSSRGQRARRGRMVSR